MDTKLYVFIFFLVVDFRAKKIYCGSGVISDKPSFQSRGVFVILFSDYVLVLMCNILGFKMKRVNTDEQIYFGSDCDYSHYKTPGSGMYIYILIVVLSGWNIV